MYWVCHWLFLVVCNAFWLGMKWTQSGKQRHDLLRDLRVDPFHVVVCFISSSVCCGGVALTQNFVSPFRAQPFHWIELMSCFKGQLRFPVVFGLELLNNFWQWHKMSGRCKPCFCFLSFPSLTLIFREMSKPSLCSW